MHSAITALLEHPGFEEGRYWRRCTIPEGADVFREGDSGSDIFYVLSGCLRVLGDVSLEDARRVRPGISDLPEGTVFGELALFDDGPRSATVSAVEEAELAVIDGHRLLEFFDQNPDWGYRVLREMLTMVVGRMRLTNKKLVSLFAWGLRAHQIEKHL